MTTDADTLATMANFVHQQGMKIDEAIERADELAQLVRSTLESYARFASRSAIRRC